MSKNVLLISVQTVKDRSGVHLNVDDKLIQHEIKVAQDIYILPAIGSDLFKSLQDGITADGNTHTEHEATLLEDYLTDALVWFVVSSLPMTSSFQFYTKGVLQKTSDNAIAPTMRDMLQLMQQYKDRAENYLQRAIRFLKANTDTYTLYRNDQSTDDGVSPAGSAYPLPMWLPDDDNCGCNEYP